MAGFERFTLVHRALPELDLADVDLTTTFLKHRLNAPLLISCMTGGTPQAAAINRTLARVAQRFGVAMGLGSGRALLEKPETLQTFSVRDEAPDVLLLANLGAVQLNKGYGIDDCRRLVELLDADALVLHLNPLQEALQPEGDTTFGDLLRAIEQLCRSAPFPIVVKEVGWGIAPGDVRALFEAGVAAVDLAGAGGTSWSEVERYRMAQPWRQRVAAEFAGWGIPTAVCLQWARAVAPSELIVASGGIRTGIDAVKALALGADVVGVAGPFLRAADAGDGATDELMRQYVEVIRIGLFVCGVRTPAALRSSRCLVRQGESPVDE